MLPLRYNVRSLLRRRTSFVMTTVGIAVVVAIFVAMLSLGAGLRETFSRTGNPENLVVMRKGTLAEAMSIVGRDDFATLAEFPGVKRDASGASLASPEGLILYMVTGVDGKEKQISVRGVTARAFVLHPVTMVKGRLPVAGRNEAIVGVRLEHKFPALEMGGRFRWAKREWQVVGVFSAGGSAYEGEVWGDLDAVLDDDRRTDYSSVIVPAESGQVEVLRSRIEQDKRFSLRAQPEPEYYRAQAGGAEPIMAAAMTVAFIMGIAAVFGALNTMYASLSGRRREVATLRALGFDRRSIAISFVLEALLQALPAGLLGCVLALLVHGQGTSMLSPMTFSQVSFAVHVTPWAIGVGLAFSALIGLLCGLFPAYSASRQPIVKGLRD